MPKPISNEVREKIIKHKQNGEREKDIARWLFISKATVTAIWGEFKRTNNYKLKYENCGRKSVISAEMEAKIMEEIKKTPDITLLELIEKYNIPITVGGLSKYLTKRGYSFKKRQHIQPNKIEKMYKTKEKNL